MKGTSSMICGFQKTTLLDYPGHVAATVFLGGCNFRCPFCHNADLVLHPNAAAQYTQQEILSYLEKRKNVLQGVCVTGGEPTLFTALPSFLYQIKELGYLIKLDTNGSNPDVLKALYQASLIDYVAMDIKSGFSDYLSVCGLSDGHADTDSERKEQNALLLENIKKSIHFLIHETDASHFQYELRTTAVKPLHTAQSFAEIAEMITGAQNYYIQSFRSGDSILAGNNAASFSSFTREELEAFATIVRPHVAQVSLRGAE